jgi:hypothetical protein
MILVFVELNKTSICMLLQASIITTSPVATVEWTTSCRTMFTSFTFLLLSLITLFFFIISSLK